MNFFRHSYLIIFVAVLLLSSCVDMAQRDNGTVIADVGNAQLTLKEVRASVPHDLFQADSVAAIKQYRNSWVRRQILAQEASRIGLDNNPEVKKNITRAIEDVLVQSLIDRVTSEAAQETITRQEAQAYYENHKDQFVLNERHVRFRHIATTTLQESRNAKAAIHRGRPWEEVAERYSVNPPEALRNANLFYPASLAVVDLDIMNRYLQRIGITEITPIHRIGEHFHFVQLMEVREAGDHPEMDWVLDQIEEWLTLERKQRHMNSFKRNLYLRAESNNEIQLYDVFTGDGQGTNLTTETDTL